MGSQEASIAFVLLHYGLRFPLTRSVPKHRWNFARADWEILDRDLDHVMQFILAESGSNDRFVKAVIAATKLYIPGWHHQCDKLYEKFNSDHESAVRLIEKLNEQRKLRREEIVEKTNITHSSRKAWNLLKKLGKDTPQIVPPKTTTADNIASRLPDIMLVQRKHQYVPANQALIPTIKYGKLH
jgi:hypothetical protein